MTASDLNACASRKAPKFVIRIPVDLKAGISDLAMKNHRSLNGEIVRAVEAWLTERPLLTLKQQLLVSQVGLNVFADIHASNSIEFSGPTDKFVVRLAPGMRESVAAEKIERRKSMNVIFSELLTWWYRHNQDQQALDMAYQKVMAKAA